MVKGFVIAIDGPVAAGKSTIAPLLVKKLHGFYLWTGAMYRCLAVYCLEKNVLLSDEKKVIEAAKKITSKIDFKEDRVFLFGKDVTKRIAEKDAAVGSSYVGVFSKARELMVEQQQHIAQQRIEKGIIVVAEGRDTGTKEFPDAALKIFLTASTEVRAKRRFIQIQAKKDNVTYEDVFQDIIERDKRDTERKADPLVKDPKKYGYFVINDENQTKEKTIDIIITELQKRNLI